jgi:hypothetical protein
MGVSSKPKVDNSYQKWSIKEADRARIEEEARQNRIDAGLEQIRAVFEGGTTATPVAATAYDPNATYYLGDGAEWTPNAQTRTVTKEPIYAPTPGAAPARPSNVRPSNPMAATVRSKASGVTTRGAGYTGEYITEDQRKFMPGFGSSSPNGGYVTEGQMKFGAKPGTPGPRQIGTRKVVNMTGPDAAAQFKTMLGDLFVRGKGQKFGGVQPILDARRKAAESFYYPQLDRNRGTAEDELTFALSRAGLRGSTAERTKGADLAEDFNIRKAEVASDIDRDISATEAGFADQRAAIEAALRASADPTAATNAAIAASKRFAADRPQMSALPNTFLAIADSVGGVRQGMDAARIRGIARGSTVNRDASRVVR